METIRFFLQFASVLAAFVIIYHFWERWRDRYTGLKAVAVRLDPLTREWIPIVRDGLKLELSEFSGLGHNSGFLDQFSFEVS